MAETSRIFGFFRGSFVVYLLRGENFMEKTMDRHWRLDGLAIVLFLTFVGLCSFGTRVVIAQGLNTQSANQSTVSDPNQALKFGEFPTALQAAQSLPHVQRDDALARISQEQFRAGAYRAMWNTADQIQDDRTRSRTIQGLGQNARGPSSDGFVPTGPLGGAGGITLGDFFPLINLIQQTIAPDDWTTTQGEGTIMPYLTGVYVNGAGELRRLSIQHNAQLPRFNRQQNLASHPVFTSTKMRKVSLVQLERRLQQLAAQGQPIPGEMKNLAGIYDLQFLIVDRENQDILIAGPAGPWKTNDEGVAVNFETGRPVLQLDDLVVCLRNVWYDGGRFGCAITPREENLKQTQGFLRDTKLKGTAFRRELQKVVGSQDIEVFGIPDNSSTAHVLVEADYRMKLIGMGLEDSIPSVPSYFETALKSPTAAPDLDVARWWFTLNYDGVATNDDRSIFQLLGTGVKVLSETELLSAQGERIHTHQSVGPTKKFAEDFTAHFDKLAEKYPIYNQLRNVFDLALVCSLIHRERLAQEVNWNLTYFGRPEDESLQYGTQELPVPKLVDSIINHDTKLLQQNGKSVRQDMIGVSGGVACEIAELISTTVFSKMAAKQVSPRPTGRDTFLDRAWWWND